MRSATAQIVDALEAVMATEGYDGASIARIAAQAGLRPGLVHYHFRDKQEILEQLARRLDDTWRQRYARRLARARENPMAQLSAFIDAHVALGDDADASAVSAWVLLAAEAVRKPEIRALYSASVADRHRVLSDLVKAALKAERKSTRPASHIAAALLSAIEGSLSLAVSAPGVLPAGYAAASLRKLAQGFIERA